MPAQATQGRKGRHRILERTRNGRHPTKGWHVVATSHMQPPPFEALPEAQASTVERDDPEPTGARQVSGCLSQPNALRALEDPERDPFEDLSD